MRIRGVEFPRALIEAHGTGELVIFVGAGASMPSPSDLPSFTELIETIRDDSGLTDVIGKVNRNVDFRPLDELLDQMADDHAVDVHARIAALVGRADSEPNPTHRAIGRLAGAAPHTRIVTTNYDRHLSTSIDHDTLEYLAPALPVGNDFDGIVYLHGSLEQNPNKLIATATDFGKAYLTDAWAARFLDRMFAAHPVLFIGYSHNDTIMKYLARGLGGRAKPRYVLTDEPSSPLWKQLGVQPIRCTHDELPVALDQWASRASMGLLAHREHMRSLVAEQEPSQIPDDISYLESIVADASTVKFFTEFARGPAWLRWMSNRNELRTLFEQRAVEVETSWPVATWFAENYVTEEHSDTALALVARFGGQLGPELAFAIGRRLAATDPLPSRLRPWTLLVAKDLRARHPNFLDFMLAKSSLDADGPSALFLFDQLSTPMLNLTPAVFGAPFDIALRGDDYWLRKSWDDVFLPNVTTVAAELLAIADAHLVEADRNLALIDESASARRRPSDSRTAIEPHPEDEYPGPLAFLIDVARDCLDDLIATENPQSYRRIEAWTDSDVFLLRRLAVHGSRTRKDTRADEKIAWLLEHEFVFDRDLAHEVELLLDEWLGRANEETAAAVLRQIAGMANDDQHGLRRAHRLLTRIRRIAPELVSAQEALDALLAEHPSLEERLPADRTDEDASQLSSLPTSSDELHRMLNENIADLVEPLVEYEAKASGFEAPRWHRFGALLSKVAQQHPDDGFAVLDAVGEGRPEIARCVVRGWANANLSTDEARKVLARIAILDLSAVIHYVAYMLARPAHGGETNWHSVPESRELAKMCWEQIDPTPMQAGTGADLATYAINHSAGRLAEYWITLVSLDWNAREDTWDGLDPAVDICLQDMLNTDDGRSEAVEIVLAGHLRFLHGADAKWCEDSLLPRFEWSEPRRAQRMWDGYLSGSTWTNGLLSAGFLNALIDAVPHRRELRSDRAARLLSQIAAVAMFADIDPSDWLRQFMIRISPSDREEWAEQVTFHLRSLEPEAAELQWHRWIRTYWTQRLESAPMTLTGAEAAAMANWAVFFADSMHDAIELALRTPGGLHERALFVYDLTPPEGPSRIARAPEPIADLLGHVLESTDKPYHGGYELPDVLRALESHGVSADAITRIREQGVRLDIPHCL